MKLLEYKLSKKKNKKGITAMSIVDDPAILINFLKLSKEEKQVNLAVDKEQQIVSGPALIPNLKIYRSAESLGLDEDGYIYFSEETVKEMAHLFMTSERMNTITLDHETENSDLKLIESWLVEDPKQDKAVALGFDVPKGTWMVSYKVENDELWNKIKKGEFNGFSIEATDFDILEKPIEMEKEENLLTEDEAAEYLVSALKDKFYLTK